MNQLKENTGSRKRTKLLEKAQVEKDEDGVVFDRDALMDKEQRLPSVLKNCGSKKRLSRRRPLASR